MKRLLILPALLFIATFAKADDDKPIRALLVIGGCCHDYEKQKDILTQGISARANVQWTIAYDPDTTTKHLNPIYNKPGWAEGYDVVVHDECSADVKDMTVVNRILQPHRDGMPGVVLHCAMHCYRTEGWPKKVTPWFEFTGLATTGHGPKEPITIDITDKKDPITMGMKGWTTGNDELYNNISGTVLDTATPLATGTQTFMRKGEKVEEKTVIIWTNVYNEKARVFGTTLGHFNENVSDPKYLDLVTRGLLWSVGKLDDKAYMKPAKKVLLDK